MKHECICHLLSAETIENLKKQFGKPEIRIGDVYCRSQKLSFVIIGKKDDGHWKLLHNSGSTNLWRGASILDEADYQYNIFDDIKAKDC